MKTKYQIIEELAKQHKIEEIISKITKGSKEDTLNDLANDLYLDLLNKPEDTIQKLYYGPDPNPQDKPYKNNQLDFFLTRAIINNINSKNSPYYYKYRKFLNKDTTPYTDAYDRPDED